MISAPIEQPSLQELQASLAEAWHVEGAYCDSAQAWQQLADLDDYKCEATLKTALAYFSLGIESRGIEWLDRALNEGVPITEILYVQAQNSMYRNDQSTSQEQYFASIEHADKDSKAKARAYNGLGVLHWKTGMYTTAREYFDHALVYNPEDPCALINYIGMSLDYDKDIDEIKLAIDQAILSAPHRYEPFVIWSRVLRKLNADQSLINNSLSAARMRQDNPCKASELVSLEDAASKAKALVEFDSLKLRVCVNLQFHANQLPGFKGFLLNAGFNSVTINGKSVAPSNIPSGEQIPDTVAEVNYYPIPQTCWLQDSDDDSDVVSITIELSGQPMPPCARQTNNEIEFDGLSAWLPLAIPKQAISWEMEVVSPELFKAFYSRGVSTESAPSLLAIRQPLEVNTKAKAVGHVDRDLLELTAESAGIGISLWQTLIGANTLQAPPVIVVNNDQSQYCYARSGFIRVSSGAVGSSISALVLHEVGHTLWGGQVQFRKQDQWLCEALAEYTLHLAEEAGHIIGYARSSLFHLSKANSGILPVKGLYNLANEERSIFSDYAMRIKGGFVIKALRKLMGDQKFKELLLSVIDVGQHYEIDAYTFFAIASRIHGQTLNWFANQWAYNDCDLEIFAHVKNIEKKKNGWKVAFVAYHSGTAIPGAPLLYLLETVSETIMIEVQPHLTGTLKEVCVPDRPVALRPDPECEWYASRHSLPLAQYC